MQKIFSVLLFYIFSCLFVASQTVIRLDASIEKQDPLSFQFNNPIDAFNAISPNGVTVIEVAPGVYWLDDPDDPEVRKAPNGIPFAVTLKTDSLIMKGLSGNPENTVFAVNRGQTQGAIGNYTMIHFFGHSIEAENITFGNYCNVDLEFPDNPALNRKARSKAIVQAQIAICEHTEIVKMNNCRFISRLNLCPFVGAQKAFFTDCHFECTDDALNGAAFYKHCSFDFYSSKPFYATSQTGAIFYDCDINTKVTGRQYLTKAGGPVTMINTRWYAPSDSLDIQWSRDDQPYYVCYADNVTLNGKPVVIDRQRPWRTVACNNPWHRYLIVEPSVTNHYPAFGREMPIYYRMLEWGQSPVHSERVFLMNYYLENPSFKELHDTIMIEHDGLRGIAAVNVDGQVYVAPSFLVSPKLTLRKGRLKVSYRLADDSAPKNKETNVDNSVITWYKIREDGRIVPVRQGRVGEVPGIDEMDVYADEAFVSVVPKYLDTEEGHYYESRAYMETRQKGRKSAKTMFIDTDFKDVPCVVALDQNERGAWQMDCFKPLDTSEYNWTADNTKPSWRYGVAVDGAVGNGLVTANRGARLWYTQEKSANGNCRLELWADPCKTAGQGFGSATGQYFDVGIGFDIQTLTGYVLRIERSPQFDRAVLFTIYRYEKGFTTPVSQSVPSNCFKTGFHLTMEYENGKLNVKAVRDSCAPSSFSAVNELPAMPNEDNQDPSAIVDAVELTADATMSGNSIYMQHTGTTGASALMLHRLRFFQDE